MHRSPLYQAAVDAAADLNSGWRPGDTRTEGETEYLRGQAELIANLFDPYEGSREAVIADIEQAVMVLNGTVHDPHQGVLNL